jgi:hypothetical protein
MPFEVNAVVNEQPKQPFAGGATTALSLGQFLSHHLPTKHLEASAPLPASKRASSPNYLHNERSQCVPSEVAPDGASGATKKGASAAVNHSTSGVAAGVVNHGTKATQNTKGRGKHQEHTYNADVSISSAPLQQRRNVRFGLEKRIENRLDELRNDLEKQTELENRARVILKERSSTSGNAIGHNRETIDRRFLPSSPHSGKAQKRLTWESELKRIELAKARKEEKQKQRELEATYSLYRHEFAKEQARRKKEQQERHQMLIAQQRGLLVAIVGASKLAWMRDIVLDKRLHELRMRSTECAALRIQRAYRSWKERLEKMRRRNAALVIQRAVRKYIIKTASSRRAQAAQLLCTSLTRLDRTRRMGNALRELRSSVMTLQQMLLHHTRREKTAAIAMAIRWENKERARMAKSLKKSGSRKRERARKGNQKQDGRERENNINAKSGQRKQARDPASSEQGSTLEGPSLAKDPTMLMVDRLITVVPWNIKMFVCKELIKLRRQKQMMLMPSYASQQEQSKPKEGSVRGQVTRNNSSMSWRRQRSRRKSNAGNSVGNGSGTARKSNGNMLPNTLYRIPRDKAMRAVMQEGVALSSWLKRRREKVEQNHHQNTEECVPLQLVQRLQQLPSGDDDEPVANQTTGATERVRARLERQQQEAPFSIEIKKE